MTNKLRTEETTHPFVYKVLLHARKLEKWVFTKDLAQYGLHKTLVHMMEDAGYITCKHMTECTAMKLTLAGYRFALSLEEETN